MKGISYGAQGESRSSIRQIFAISKFASTAAASSAKPSPFAALGGTSSGLGGIFAAAQEIEKSIAKVLILEDAMQVGADHHSALRYSAVVSEGRLLLGRVTPM